MPLDSPTSREGDLEARFGGALRDERNLSLSAQRQTDHQLAQAEPVGRRFEVRGDVLTNSVEGGGDVRAIDSADCESLRGSGASGSRACRWRRLSQIDYVEFRHASAYGEEQPVRSGSRSMAPADMELRSVSRSLPSPVLWV